MFVVYVLLLLLLLCNGFRFPGNSRLWRKKTKTKKKQKKRLLVSKKKKKKGSSFLSPLLSSESSSFASGASSSSLARSYQKEIVSSGSEDIFPRRKELRVNNILITHHTMSLSLSSANMYSSAAKNTAALCTAGGGRPKTTPTLMISPRPLRRRSGFPIRSSCTSTHSSDTFSDVNDELKKKRALLKEKLIESCRGTYRGAIGFSNDREREDIRKAKEALETFGAKEEEEKEEDWMRNRLNGRWKLIYTTALDVTGLLVFSVPPPPLPFFPPPPIVVADIYQEFKTDAKEIVNEIRASVPWLLEEKDGVILRVNATYKEVSSSSGDSSNNSKKALELVFQEAVVSDVRISEFTETLLAPAILPRSELNQRALLFLRDFEVRFPLFGRAARAMGGSDENGVSGAAVGRYEFSYCDEDVLIGKATGSQGIFIFTKDHQSQM